MDKKLIKEHFFQVKASNIFLDPNAFQKVQETQDGVDKYSDKELDILPMCIHGHIIRSPQEMGGACYCGSVLCKECAAQRQCYVDGHVLCKRHAIQVGDKLICESHGLLTALWVMISG